jgi:hypothetical protein
MKQLDGLKSGGYSRGDEAQRLAKAVREFMGKGLEACGGAGGRRGRCWCWCCRCLAAWELRAARCSGFWASTRARLSLPPPDERPQLASPLTHPLTLAPPPPGHNFLTVLGAHEGEGLVLEQNAAVAGGPPASAARLPLCW